MSSLVAEKSSDASVVGIHRANDVGMVPHQTVPQHFRHQFVALLQLKQPWIIH